MVEVYAVAIAYLQIVQQVDAVNDCSVASNEMHRPVGTVADCNVTYGKIVYVNKRKHMRTWVESGNGLKLVRVVKLLSHEGNAVAMNYSLACYGNVVGSVGIYPHHALTTVLTKGTEVVDALIRIGYQHSRSLKVQIDIRFQAQRS